MKKILTLTLLFTTFLITYGQNVFQNQSSINEILCKEWAYNYSGENGSAHKRLPKQEVYNLIFLANQTLQVIKSETKDSGTWCLDPDLKIIAITLRGHHELNIFSISEKEIILVSKDYKSKNFPNSFIQFIPQK